MRRHTGLGIVWMLCLVLLFSADVEAKSKVRISRIRIKSNYGKIVHVGKGKKVRVTTKVTARPNKSSNKGIRYQSKNKRIARIDAAGQVKGIKLGTTRIYAISKKVPKRRGSLKVKVVKPITKIILKETSKTVKTGERFELKKKVVPGDTGFKQLVWSSSVPSVAKVSASGRVTALRPGNAKITAKAVDGSGTKAVCKVAVQSLDTVNMTSVRALSATTVRVSFDREIVLTQSQFSMSGKFCTVGGNNKTYKVSRLRNYGNTTYDLRVERGSTFEKNMLLRVNVSTLPGNGTKMMETQVSFVKESPPADTYATGESGRYIEPLRFDLSEYGYGALAYQVKNLPSGISYVVRDNVLVFTGKTSEAYFGKETIITATDEMEREIKAKLYWYIGSEQEIVGYARDKSLVTGEELKERDCLVQVVGGSGQYNYAFSGLPEGIEGDAETGKLSGQAQVPGSYQVQVMVRDREDESRKIAVSFLLTVESGYMLWGTVKDSQGLAMPDACVIFSREDGDNTYQVRTDGEGNYVLRVVSGTYHGEAAVNTGDVISDELCEYTVAGDSYLEFSPECYRVEIQYDETQYVLEEGWMSGIQDGVAYDGSRVIYAVAGNHDLYAYARRTDEASGKEKRYLLRAQFTVSDTGVTIAAVVSEIPVEVETPEVETGEKRRTSSPRKFTA